MLDLKLDEINNVLGGTLYGTPDKTVLRVTTDSRDVEAGDLFIALKGDKFDGHSFVKGLPHDVAGAVVEYRIDTDIPLIVVPDALRALGTLATYQRDICDLTYAVAITGSVGKTTTKELIANVLSEKFKTHYTKGNFNNHIGLPLTLLGLEKSDDVLISEMGMSARGEIEYLTRIAKPNIAVITNIGVSHIEILGSREEIRNAKLEILCGMEKGSTVILNGDEPLLNDETAAELLRGFKVVRVGLGDDNDYYPLDIYKGSDFLSFNIMTRSGEDRLTIPAVGDHFVRNAMFAYAVGVECGVSRDDIKKGLSNYESEGLRQRIYKKGDITVIADCYNASPESMSAALAVLGDRTSRRVAVLGDMLELGEMTEKLHREVGEMVKNAGVDMLYTYGEAAKFIAAGAMDAGMRHGCCACFTSKSVLAHELQCDLSGGETVLFKASRKMKLEDIISLAGLSEE